METLVALLGASAGEADLASVKREGGGAHRHEATWLGCPPKRDHDAGLQMVGPPRKRREVSARVFRESGLNFTR